MRVKMACGNYISSLDAIKVWLTACLVSICLPGDCHRVNHVLPSPTTAIAFQLHYPDSDRQLAPFLGRFLNGNTGLGTGIWSTHFESGKYLPCLRLKGDKLGIMQYLMFEQAFKRLYNAVMLLGPHYRHHHHHRHHRCHHRGLRHF